MSTIPITPQSSSTTVCRTSNTGPFVRILKKLKDMAGERPAVALGSTLTCAGLSCACINNKPALKLLGPFQFLAFIYFGFGMFSKTKDIAEEKPETKNELEAKNDQKQIENKSPVVEQKTKTFEPREGNLNFNAGNSYGQARRRSLMPINPGA